MGGDGVRVNINGNNYVMFGQVGSKTYATAGISQQRRFHLSAPLVSMLYDQERKYTLSIDYLSTSALKTDIKYDITDNASLQVADGDKSPLTGWIKFTMIDLNTGKIEACFELSSTQFSLRHGFLRLPMNVSTD